MINWNVSDNGIQQTYISSFFSTLLARRCHMRSAFLPALCIIRRKLPICISISILLLPIRLTLQCLFNQRTIFYNAKTSHLLCLYIKLIITIPAIILAGAHSAYSGAFAIRTANQRNHILLHYLVHESIKYTNTNCLFDIWVFCILWQLYFIRKDMDLYKWFAGFLWNRTE